MKLTKREKILLLILVFIAIWFMLIKFLILPGLANIDVLRREISSVQQEKDNIINFVETNADLPKRLEDVQQKRLSQAFFYESIDDVFVDRMMQKYADKHNLKIFNEVMPYPSQIELQEYLPNIKVMMYPLKEQVMKIDNQKLEEYQEEVEKITPSKEAVEMPMYSVTITVTGTNQDIINFADELEHLGTSIIVSAIKTRVMEPEKTDITVNVYYIE